MSDSNEFMNEPKNVLIVSTAAPPFTNPESLQVSKYLKYLVDSNWRLSLVTAKISDRNLGWRKVDNKYETILDNLQQVIKIPSYYTPFLDRVIRRTYPAWFQKPDNERRFADNWKTVLKKLELKPDLIYSRSSPLSSALMALKLAKHFQIPWIMHLSDPWTMSPFFNYSNSTKRFHRMMEQECLEAASQICLTSQQQIQLYQKQYPEHKHKFKWFPNVYDDDDLSFHEPDPESMIFVHTGNFYSSTRSPEPFLRALDAVYQEDPGLLADCQFLFAGFQDNSTKRDLLKYQKVGVRHIGPITVQECSALYAKAAVLVIIDFELPSEKAVFLLSKALDYMSSGKPILTITTPGSTLHNTLKTTHGRCYSHQDIAGIKNQLVDLVTKYKAQDPLFKTPFPVDQKYSASYNTERLEELFRATLNPGLLCKKL